MAVRYVGRSALKSAVEAQLQRELTGDEWDAIAPPDEWNEGGEYTDDELLVLMEHARRGYGPLWSAAASSASADLAIEERAKLIAQHVEPWVTQLRQAALGRAGPFASVDEASGWIDSHRSDGAPARVVTVSVVVAAADEANEVRAAGEAVTAASRDGMDAPDAVVLSISRTNPMVEYLTRDAAGADDTHSLVSASTEALLGTPLWTLWRAAQALAAETGWTPFDATQHLLTAYLPPDGPTIRTGNGLYGDRLTLDVPDVDSVLSEALHEKLRTVTRAIRADAGRNQKRTSLPGVAHRLQKFTSENESLSRQEQFVLWNQTNQHHKYDTFVRFRKAVNDALRPPRRAGGN
ncbi:MAG: hypothetical protein AB7T37_04150 [Dehalococcoidia bacterium]